MKIYLVLFSFLCLTYSSFSQDWLYVSQLTGTGVNAPTRVINDDNGNSYIYGTYSGTISHGLFTITSVSGSTDLFLTKYDIDGNCLWLKSIGSDASESSGDIKLNLNQDAIYVSGGFQSTCYFDLSSLVTSDLYDGFLSKYDLNGNIIWAKNAIWGTNNQRIASIAIDESDNIACVGTYQSSATLEGGVTLPGNAFFSSFVSKFNSNGSLLWAKGYNADNTNNSFGSIVRTSNGFAILGRIRGTLTLDLGPITSYNSGFINILIYYINDNGIGQWSRKIGSAVASDFDVKITCNGEKIYCSAVTNSATISIDSTQTDVITKAIGNSGNTDILCFTYNTSGIFQWSKDFSSAGIDYAWGYKFKNNRILMTGQYGANISFDSYNLANSGGADIFVAEMDTNGVVSNAFKLGNTAADIGQACVVDIDDNLIIAGDFTSTSLTVGATTLPNPNAPTKDGFIAKWGCPKVTPSFTSDSISCAGGSDGIATVTPSGMTSYIWSNGLTTESISGLTEDTYTVTVTGLYGCKYIDSIFVTNKRQLEVAMAASTYQIDCAAGNDGVGIVAATFGDPAYTYLWDNLETTDTVTNLTVGKHYVTVTDGCLSKVDSVEITNLPTLYATLNTHAQILICAADINGEVTALTTDGVAPFSYEWDDVTLLTPVRNDLDTGWHYVTITDVCNVPNIDSIKVSYMPEVNITITSSIPATCPAGSDGSAFVFASSGIPPYTYEWDNSVTTATNSTLDAGWAYVTVTDFCITRTDSVLITSNPAMNISITSFSDVTCSGNSDGTAAVTPLNGASPFTYAWDGTTATDSLVTDLPAGVWTVTVTDQCGFLTSSVTIGSIPQLTATISSHSTVVLCETSADGEATVTPVDGTAPYSYLWTDGSTNATNSALTIGKHYVTVSDACGNTAIDSIQVNFMSSMNASITSSTNTLCPSSNDGSAFIFATGGVPPYSYEWSNGITLDQNNTLPAGMAYVTVTDFCISIIDSVLISSNPPMTLSITSQTDVTCPGNSDGTAIVTPVNGTPPFAYVWDGTTDTDSSVTDLPAGTWYVTVTGMCGNQVASVTIGSVPQLSATISDHSIVLLCETSTDGEATIYPVDGLPPYEYLWTNGDTTATVYDLTVGKHYVTVTDGCGNTILDSIQVNFMAPMNATISYSENTSCSFTNDGYASVFASGGVPPYNYTWSNGVVNSVNDTLYAGTAYVTISDACITIVDSVEIGTNPPLAIAMTSTTDVSCPGYTDGQATIGAANGAPPYFYQWSGSTGTNSSVNDLPSGTQNVTVTDGCGSTSLTFFIGTKTPLSFNLTLDTLATCMNSADAYATAHLSDGTLPFTYLWENSASTDSVAGDLTVGVHYITITDACGDHIDFVTVTSITPLSATYIASNVICNADTTGNIVLIPANGVEPYSYIWSHSSVEVDSIGNGLIAGTYYYTVTDFCGSVYNEVTLTEPGAISLSTIVTDQTFTGTYDGEIDLIVSGGIAPYTFEWSNDRLTEDIDNLGDNTYYVTVTDYNLCSHTDSAIVLTKFKYVEVMNAFTPNADGTNDEWTIKYIDQYPNCQVDIFNQWGMNVFTSKGYTTKWNGKKDNSGNDLPAAAYYYIIDLGDGSDQYTGSVTIIR